LTLLNLVDKSVDNANLSVWLSWMLNKW